MPEELKTEPFKMLREAAGFLPSPYAGPLSQEESEGLKQLSLETKYGTSFSEELKDAAQREGAVVVLNLAGDDSQAPVNAYLAVCQKEKLETVLQAVAEAVKAEQIFVVKPENLAFEPSLKMVQVVHTEASPVLREEGALYHKMETGELRSCLLEKTFPSEGYKGLPTVMADGETLYRIYEKLKAGACREAAKLTVIRGAGLPGEGVIGEFPEGTSLKAMLASCGVTAPEKSLLLGGVTGLFAGTDQWEQLKSSFDSLWDLVVVYGAGDCMADVGRQLSQCAEQTSCKKCVLCREGSWQLRSIFQDITEGKARRDALSLVADIGPLIQAGAACSFGRNMARLLVSAAEENRKELEAHFLKKTCPAGVCSAFSRLVIDPAKCTGCTDCLDECDEDAITGKKGFIHMIDGELCENCKKCVAVCEEGAIVPQDGTIRIPKRLVKAGKF